MLHFDRLCFFFYYTLNSMETVNTALSIPLQFGYSVLHTCSACGTVYGPAVSSCLLCSESIESSKESSRPPDNSAVPHTSSGIQFDISAKNTLNQQTWIALASQIYHGVVSRPGDSDPSPSLSTLIDDAIEKEIVEFILPRQVSDFLLPSPVSYFCERSRLQQSSSKTAVVCRELKEYECFRPVKRVMKEICQKKSTVSQEEKSDIWECTHCTFYNSCKKQRRCECCNALRAFESKIISTIPS